MLISIITINKNNYEGLSLTLNSVRGLIEKIPCFFELIIIDGASTDNSIPFVMKNIDIVKHFESGVDSGIYNAMNKGVKAASGEFIIFMNSGDLFASEFDVVEFNKIISGYASNKYPIFALNNIVKIGCFYKRRKLRSGLDYPSHQATIYPSLVFVENLYDENFKIAGDYHFFKKVIKKFEVSYVDMFVSVNEIGGISNNWKSLDQIKLHVNEIALIDNMNYINKYKLFINIFVKFILIKIIGMDLFYILIEYFHDRNSRRINF